MDKGVVLSQLWGEEEEKEPIDLSFPVLISQENLLYPVSLLLVRDSGELEVERPESTVVTSVLDKSVVLLPVVHRVEQASPPHHHHSPYLTLPPASSRYGVACHTPEGVICYYVEMGAEFPSWGTIEEQVVHKQRLIHLYPPPHLTLLCNHHIFKFFPYQ